MCEKHTITFCIRLKDGTNSSEGLISQLKNCKCNVNKTDSSSV